MASNMRNKKGRGATKKRAQRATSNVFAMFDQVTVILFFSVCKALITQTAWYLDLRLVLFQPSRGFNFNAHFL